jgi:hypothetical protein
VNSANMFRPNPYLADAINGAVVQSEIEGGVYVRDLLTGRALEVKTQHRTYFVIRRDKATLIWGHPKYCPNPIPVVISGSNWGGSMLMRGFIGRGMHLEFRHPEYSTPIITSRIRDVTETSEPREASAAKQTEGDGQAVDATSCSV